jgi:hypothetical protein
MNCRLCQKNDKLVKAHVIPEAFFRELREVGGETPIIISSGSQEFPKRAPIGVYDSTILCAECEKRFGVPDEYAVKVFRDGFDKTFIPMRHNDRVIAYQSGSVDQGLLEKFLVATLWRASVSTHPFYSKVTLGPVEQIAQSVFLDQAPDERHRFATVLSRWEAGEESPTITWTMLSPFRERWSGISAYRFYFGRTTAYIKVDNRPYRSPLRDLAVGVAQELTVVARDLESSKDFQALVSVAQKSGKLRRRG